MTDAVQQESEFARHPDVIGAEIDGEVILLDAKSWDYLEFDSIGARIWVLLERPQTLSALVDTLVREFDVNDALCRSDTELFLGDLATKGIVIRRESTLGQRLDERLAGQP